MTQIRGPLPARAAAGRVTGAVNGTTIQAVALHGTTWGGTVTLRISVELDGGAPFQQSQRTTRCYRYDFAYPRRSDDGRAHETTCPTTRAIDVDQPPLPAGITAGTRTTARRALTALSADRRNDDTAIRAALVTALGTDYTMSVSLEIPHFVWIRYGDGCLTAQVSAHTLHVGQPQFGDACFGG